MKYFIKNIDKDQYIDSELNGAVSYTDNKDNAILFNDESDAETTLELLNDIHEDCFVLEETGEPITDVLFLIERGDNMEEGAFDGDAFAYFPNEAYNDDPNLKTSYAHIGQHSACHVDYAAECKQATPEQYQDLKTELEGIGYKLNVLNK